MTDKKRMYGLNLIGRIRVFRKDKEVKGKDKKTYIISDVWFNVSEKNEDGTWFNESTNLLFKKGLDIPINNRTIEIDSFPVVTGNGKYRKVAYMVKDWGYSED